MKEMIYSAKRINPPEILADGDYKGFHFYVLNLGTHPCAYVDVTETNLSGKDYTDIDISCHGGLTYSEEYLRTVDKKGWFIGWDYAHCCDFAGYELEMPMDIRINGKRWTTTEIVEECKQVIDQITIDHPTEKGGAMSKTINLPCYIGDIIYFAVEDYHDSAVIDEIHITEQGIMFTWVQYEVGVDVTECWDEGNFDIEDIGKTVFLTREDAIKALKDGERE